MTDAPSAFSRGGLSRGGRGPAPAERVGMNKIAELRAEEKRAFDAWLASRGTAAEEALDEAWHLAERDLADAQWAAHERMYEERARPWVGPTPMRPRR